MDSIDISPITPIDFESIIEIADESFGKDYVNANQLNKLIKSKGVFLKVKINKQIVGFCFTLLNPKNEVKNLMKINFSLTHISLPCSIIKTIAVKKEFQLQGIGTKLIEASMQQMKTLFGTKVFLYMAWTESKSFEFTLKLKKFGFKSVEIIPNYWYQESIKMNFGCLRCGNPPCNCSLTLFKLTLD